MTLCLSLLVAALPIIVSTHPALAAATTSVHIVKYYADGTTVMNETTVNYSWMEANLPVLGDGTTHYYHQGPVFKDNPDEATEQLIRWNSSEDTNVKDMGAVKGTNVKDLCNLVGGAASGDTIRIKASDGLYRDFAYQNVYNYSSREGPMVLTWYKDGLYPDTGWTDGMRIIWFADNGVNPWGDHVFGNWDWHEAAESQYWYYYISGAERYPTTTGLSAKYVSDIFIYTDEPTPTPSASPTVSPTPTSSPTKSPTSTHIPVATTIKTPTATVVATQTAVPSVTTTMTNTSTLTSSPTTTSEPEATLDTQLPSSETIGPSGGNTSSTDGNIFVVCPPGAVDQDTVITISPMHGKLGIGQTYFAITATDNGTSVTTLAANVTVCVRYTDADLGSVGGDPSLLQLAYLDEGAAKWIALDTTVNPDQRLACASTNHLSEWTLMKATTGSSIPVWVWPVVAAIVIVLISIALLIHGHISTKKKKTVKEET